MICYTFWHCFSSSLLPVGRFDSVTDEEAIHMSRFVLKEEGLFLGSSSAVNLAASYKLAKSLKLASDDTSERKTIVTILCDSGQRHLSKFWNDGFLIQNGFCSKAPTTNPKDIHDNSAPMCHNLDLLNFWFVRLSVSESIGSFFILNIFCFVGFSSLSLALRRDSKIISFIFFLRCNLRRGQGIKETGIICWIGTGCISRRRKARRGGSVCLARSPSVSWKDAGALWKWMILRWLAAWTQAG